MPTIPGLSSRTLILSLLLVTAAFAGCTDPESGANDTGSDDDGVPDDGSGPDPATLTDAQARTSYQNALKILSDGPQDVARVGMTMNVEAANGSDTESGVMKMLFDEDKRLMVMTMEGDVFDQTSEEGGFQMRSGGPPSSFLMGQVHMTSFFGVPPDLAGAYDENATPPSSFEDVEGDPSAGEEDEEPSLSDPMDFMTVLGQGLPDDADLSFQTTTYEGNQVLEITTSYEENGTTFEVRALIDQASERPVFVETTISDPGAEEAVLEDGRYTMTFAYGAEASHEHEQALLRLETMTLTSGGFEPSMMMGGPDDADDEKSWTIQPSQNPGMVPLTEIEVHVTTAEGSESEPALILEAESGTKENDDVVVTYHDNDADGHVSPGDEITLRNKTEAGGEYTVAIYDEETGMTLVPSPGLLALVGVLGIAAIVVRRRR